jgi:hypothetical protein
MRAVIAALVGGGAALAAAPVTTAQEADGARPYFSGAARLPNLFDDPRADAAGGVRPSDDPIGDLIVRVDIETTYAVRLDAPFGPPLEPLEPMGFGADGGLEAIRAREISLVGKGFVDRLRLASRGEWRRADGVPLPPTGAFAGTLEDEQLSFNYRRGWAAARGETASGLEVALIPHAGINLAEGQGALEAGATLRIGEGLDDMVQNGRAAFGERARWYLFAAGSGRAVGYNWARTRDGDFASSGVSHDSGAFLGDASVGLDWRRGAMQSSVGLVYREIDARELLGDGFDRDVSEGLVAFQLSIKPE